MTSSLLENSSGMFSGPMLRAHPLCHAAPVTCIIRGVERDGADRLRVLALSVDETRRMTPAVWFSRGDSHGSNPTPLELRVGVDVGAYRHAVAIGLSDGSVLEEFANQRGQSPFLGA